MGYLQWAFQRIWFQWTRDLFCKSINFFLGTLGPCKEVSQHCIYWVLRVICFWFQIQNLQFWVFWSRLPRDLQVWDLYERFNVDGFPCIHRVVGPCRNRLRVQWVWPWRFCSCQRNKVQLSSKCYFWWWRHQKEWECRVCFSITLGFQFQTLGGHDWFSFLAF